MITRWGIAAALVLPISASACDAVIVLRKPSGDDGLATDGGSTDGPVSGGGVSMSGGGPATGTGGAPLGGDASNGGGPGSGGSPSAGGASCDADLSLPTGEPTVIASGLDRPVGLALVGDDVYVTQTGQGAGAGALVRVPKLGGSLTVVAGNQNVPWAVTADASYVYWVSHGEGDDGSLSRLALANGTVEVLAEKLRYPWGIAAHDGSLYATELNNNRVLAIRPNKSLEIVTNAFTGLPIAVDETGVYVGVLGLGSWGESISRVDNRGTPTLLYEQLAPSDVLVLDGEDVYYSEGGVLHRGSRSGAQAVTLADVTMKGSISAVVADCFVYFAAQEETYVGRVPVDGGAMQVLAPSEALPAAIAVDAEAIYWVNQANGTLVRLEK